MNSGAITKKTARRTAAAKIDWTRLDAMSAEERHAAAISDPDAKPLTPEDFKRMKRTPQVKVIRRALDLSQEDFAARFHIPIGTLRDWEQGRKEPDAAAKAYLRVIAREPDVVRKALLPRRRTAA
jgi:putative transcriptional regulator